jgi:hypothetical protein
MGAPGGRGCAADGEWFILLPMNLLDAPPYDPSRERRRMLRTAAVILFVFFVALFVYVNRYWPEEHKVDKFFTALEKQDFKTAYGIWMNDPAWQQHPQKFQRYAFNEFYTDWGPGGEWGIVRNHRVEGAVHPKGGSGVVVVVEVNGRSEPARVWVEKSDKTLSFSPY